jgi:hypothetical protein
VPAGVKEAAMLLGAWCRHRGHSGMKRPDDGTGRDAAAQGGRRTCRQCYGAEVATSERRIGGNHGGNANKHATEEDLGEGGEGPDRWGPSISDRNGKMIMGYFCCGVGQMVV